MVASMSGGVHKENYSPEQLLSQAKDYFETRLTIMPESKRWGEALSAMNKLYNDDILSTETFSKIKCPLYLMSGDQDNYNTVDTVGKVYKEINGSENKHNSRLRTRGILLQVRCSVGEYEGVY